jgi:ABC-type amino acid transport substrate-binding protein
VLLIIALWMVSSAVNGITAAIRNDPDPVAGGPFPTVTPTSTPSSESSGPDLINDGKLMVAVPEGFGSAERAHGVGNYAGFDLALLDLVAHDLGAASVDTGKHASVKTRVGMLRRGEADLALFEITPQLQREVDIVGPYLVNDVRLAVPASSPATGLDTLGDGKVCAPRDSTAATELTGRLGERLITRARLDNCANLLGTNVTAIVGDEIALRTLPAMAAGELRLVGAPLGKTEYGIGVPPDDSVLYERVQAVLRKVIRNNTWKQRYETYLGAPAPTPPTIR